MATTVGGDRGRGRARLESVQEPGQIALTERLLKEE